MDHLVGKGAGMWSILWCSGEVDICMALAASTGQYAHGNGMLDRIFFPPAALHLQPPKNLFLEFGYC
jgi:hypothetical protein